MEIYTDSRSDGMCTTCRQRIEWATQVDTGRRVPIARDAVALTTRRDEAWRTIEQLDAGEVHRCRA